MIELFVIAHIVGGACLAVAGLQAVERREIGPVAPLVASAGFAVLGVGLILIGRSVA